MGKQQREGQKYHPNPKRDYLESSKIQKGDKVVNPKVEEYNMPQIKKWGRKKKSITI